MGIASFQNLLAPYATNLLLQQCSTSTNSSSFSSSSTTPHHIAIIDGPGLAYHALYIAQSLVQTRLAQWRRKCKQQNPTVASNFTRRERALAAVTAATPSYRAVAATMLSWLDALRNHGIHVGAILFDGALPLSKQHVRLERMSKLVSRLQNCRETFKEEYDDEDNGVDLQQEQGILQARFLGVEKSREDKQKSSENSLTFHNHRTGNAAWIRSEIDFPPPIFLVSAMLECLRHHELYGQITRMVPGEADPFCAAYAQKLASEGSDACALIVTSDSDLFAYHLNDRVQIMLFKDVSIVDDDAGDMPSALSAQVYCTTRIAEQFEIESLLPLAYSVYTDRYRSLGTHLVEARKASKARTRDFESFSCQYDMPEFDIKSLASSSTLQRLDTKVSEAVQSWADDNDVLRTSTILHMYLPSSSEDAQRGSMWSYGADLRQLGYSIMLRSGSVQATSIVEHYRKGKRIGTTTIALYNASDIVSNIKDLSNALQGAITVLKTDVRSTSWRYLGLFFLCNAYVAEERVLPSRRMLVQICLGRVMRSWTALHLQAQYQAILDSWRILRQCISVHLELAQDEYQIREAQMLLQILQDVSGDTIQDMFDPIPDLSKSEDVHQVLTSIFEHVGIVEQPEESGKKRQKKRKKNRSGGTMSSKSKRAGSTSSNMFSMLAEEND